MLTADRRYPDIDSLTLALVHIVGGDAACVLLSLDAVLVDRHVVDAHLHEGLGVDDTEARSHLALALLEDLSAQLVPPVGWAGVDHDGVVDGPAAAAKRPGGGEVLGVGGHLIVSHGEVVARLVIVCAEETSSLAEVPK